ncbi:protein of unknown function [Cardinium endosymbiont cEper1 of Encarsia pergandiella]|nr:protein of unknown function [Cardinium endosymbiont cEper1 of Encarsia pergandiella]
MIAGIIAYGVKKQKLSITNIYNWSTVTIIHRLGCLLSYTDHLALYLQVPFF